MCAVACKRKRASCTIMCDLPWAAPFLLSSSSRKRKKVCGCGEMHSCRSSLHVANINTIVLKLPSTTRIRQPQRERCSRKIARAMHTHVVMFYPPARQREFKYVCTKFFGIIAHNHNHNEPKPSSIGIPYRTTRYVHHLGGWCMRFLAHLPSSCCT